MILDNKLSFNQHVDAICKKATNLLNLCRRNLHMCTPQIKEAAYKAIVRPQLDYASPAWNPHTSRNINKIEAVQKRAARFILGNYQYGPQANITEQIQSQLKWPLLQHRRAAYDLSMFYKIRSNIINIKFPQSVQVSPKQDLRYIRIQALHSDTYKNSFFCRTVRLWNSLPTTITTSGSLDIFKTQTITWITPLTWVKVNNTWALV